MPLPSRDTHELSGYRPLADINVTPLVDVMLVLLIIFMVTAPMLVAGLSVNLPRAGSARPLKPDAPVIVTVAKDGSYLIGEEPVAAAALAEAVRARLGDDASRPAYIRGDRETLYGNVIAAIDLLTAAGIAKVVMMVERGTSPPGPATDAARHHPARDSQ